MKKKVLSAIMAFIIIIGVITIPETGFIMEAEAATIFSPRLHAPDTDNKYYIKSGHTVGGVRGVNDCILGNSKGRPTSGSVLPNCVGYAWGRAYEIMGTKPKLSINNANTFWGRTSDGYSRGQTVRLGAIACWDGTYGHVAVVERIEPTNDGKFVVTFSDSAWGTNGNPVVFRTFTRTLTSLNQKPTWNSLNFQGYIYIGNYTAPTAFTIKYNANGGSGSMADTSVTHGVNTTLRANTFTRNGFAFDGWFAQRTSDNKWRYQNPRDTSATGWYKEGSQPSGWVKFNYKNSGTVSATVPAGNTVIFFAQWKADFVPPVTTTPPPVTTSSPPVTTTPPPVTSTPPSEITIPPPALVWSEWSAWQDAPVTATNNREVNTRQVVASYNMVSFAYQRAASPFHRSYRAVRVTPGTDGTRQSYGVFARSNTITENAFENASRVSAGSWSSSGKYPGFNDSSSTGYILDSNGYIWFVESINYKTQYSFRERR